MSQIRLLPSGREVECQQGETILAALENAGYALPNNCRAGACGECKIKVSSGEYDQGMVLDMALSAEEREQGYGLMCMAKPLSSLVEIEWGTDDAKPKLFPPTENMRFSIVDRIERTHRIIELRLRPVGKPMRYWPGQYVILSNTQGTVKARSYSIANAPSTSGEITLQVTRVPGGETSNWVHDNLYPGEMVSLSGPYGTFIGDPSTDGPVLCIAAGSGLAPILALSEAALRRGFRQPVTLLFSARTESDLYNHGLLKFWDTKHRRFKFIPTLTREKKEGIQHGRVPDILPSLFPDLSKHSVYIAGSPEFVESAKEQVVALGARPEWIHEEGYFAQQASDID